MIISLGFALMLALSVPLRSVPLTLGLFGAIAIGGVFVMRLVNRNEIVMSLGLKKIDYELE